VITGDGTQYLQSLLNSERVQRKEKGGKERKNTLLENSSSKNTKTKNLSILGKH
jgi:hypothetical protein